MISKTQYQPTLADVEQAIKAKSSLQPERRSRMRTTLHWLSRLSGIPLSEIPATMPALIKIVTSIEPAAHGIKRVTLHNARNFAMHGMKESGLVPQLATYREHRKPLTLEWSIVFARLHTQSERVTLWALIHYLSEQGITPGAVTDTDFEAFKEHLSNTSFRANHHTRVRDAALAWNKLRAHCPDLKLQELTPPPSRLRRLPYSNSDFPGTLQQEIFEHKRWLTGKDPFADNARRRAVSPNTANAYGIKLHRYLNTLAVLEGGVETITSFQIALSVPNFKRTLAILLETDGSAQKVETYQTAVMLHQMARDFLQFEDEHVSALEKIRTRLRRPQMVMTDKNKKLVSQFDDPVVRQRLFRAPETIWQRMKADCRLSARRSFAVAHAAMGIGILTYMPLRLKNLANLEFGQNIILKPRGTSSLIIPAEDTKAGRAVEFDIPEPVASLIIEFYDTIAPSVLGKHPRWLFCRPDGEVKSYAQVRQLTQSYFKEYVGFHMNPHAFRHLCAKFILDANPGAHTLVQEILGHKSVEISTAFYAGLNSRRAGRHHSELIQRELVSQAPAPSNSRRRRKET